MATVLLLASCVKEPQMTPEQIEQRSLRAWIERHHPELVDNYQAEGGYYVEVLDEGCLDSMPLAGKDVWLWYDFTGRDLEGNVCESRDDAIAYQQGTFTNYAHYVPAYRFSGKESHSLMEGTYLATFNELTIDGQPFSVRYGTKLRLYLPSSVIDGSKGLTADGGYEGQFSLDGNVPMIMDMTIYGHITNPVAYEGNHVDSFATINGGLCTDHKATPTDTEKSTLRRHLTRGDEVDHEARFREFYDGRWHQPLDTLAQLYVNYAYSPATQSFDFNAIGSDTLMYPLQNEYRTGSYGVYNGSLSSIDSRINEALVRRFGAGVTGEELEAADSVRKKSTVKIWYVGRFLDGYVFDTNIDEVKEIVYGEVVNEGKAISINVADALGSKEFEFINAWRFSIPTLRVGQWAALLTVSNYAYGVSGKTGSHTTETSNNNAYYDYMNYMNYMNSYYGYGYNNMYNNGYYGFNPYYYGMPSTNIETTVTTTTNSEIPSFTPLLFQFYVE